MARYYTRRPSYGRRYSSYAPRRYYAPRPPMRRSRRSFYY